MAEQAALSEPLVARGAVEGASMMRKLWCAVLLGTSASVGVGIGIGAVLWADQPAPEPAPLVNLQFYGEAV